MNKRWILTSAHCLRYRDPSKVVVATGTVLVSEGTIYRVDKIILHEDYDDLMKIADIAMMKTSEDIRFDDTVQPIPLATSDQILSKAVVSGWGRISMESFEYPETLQFLEMEVLSNEDCQNRFKNAECSPIKCNELVHPTTVCAHNPSGSTNRGDSGGPLIADGHLIGVVAWGISSSLVYPKAFMRVSEYIDWIDKTMNKF